MKERAGNRSVKRQSLRLLSNLPIDWQWETHPGHLVLRSQSLKVQAATMSWGQMITKSYVFGVWIFIDRQVPSILAGVSLILSALVVGNGSYILRAYGHDLHSPTLPIHTWDGVPPIQIWDGVPLLVQTWDGVPPIHTWDGVHPLIQIWDGVPPIQTWDEVPPCPCPDLGWGTALPPAPRQMRMDRWLWKHNLLSSFGCGR